MQNSNSIFVKKASEYIEIIDGITSNYISELERRLDKRDSEYKNQEKNIFQIKIKIKLLFAEFNKGEFFIEKINESDKQNSFFSTEIDKLNVYKETLLLLIDHIENFVAVLESENI
jgi:hypothetical protein